MALAVVLLAGILSVIGTALFLGDWLLGSMGWGVLHGVLMLLAVAVACGLAAVGIGGGRIGWSFAVAVAVAVVAAIALGLALPNRAHAMIGEQVLPGIEAGIRPLVVGSLIGAAVGLILGGAAMLRIEAGSTKVGSAIGGLVGGAVIGAISAIDVGPQVGVGIGIAVGILIWMVLMGVDTARIGIDMDTLKARFYPTQTIETSKETLEWLQSKMPPGNGS